MPTKKKNDGRWRPRAAQLMREIEGYDFGRNVIAVRDVLETELRCEIVSVNVCDVVRELGALHLAMTVPGAGQMLVGWEDFPRNERAAVTKAWRELSVSAPLARAFKAWRDSDDAGTIDRLSDVMHALDELAGWQSVEPFACMARARAKQLEEEAVALRRPRAVAA